MMDPRKTPPGAWDPSLAAHASSFRYPLETLRDRYVTLFGGASFDLKPLEIGVNAEALRRNTHLAPFQDQVLVSAEGDARSAPLITKPFYTIVPLDDARPEALELSPHGEAVFSCFELDARDHERSPLHALREGSAVTLNAVLSRRWNTGTEKWQDLFRINPRSPWAGDP